MQFDMTGRGSYTRDNLSVTRAAAARVPFVAGTSLRSASINFINPSAFAAWPALCQSHYPVYHLLRKPRLGFHPKFLRLLAS